MTNRPDHLRQRLIDRLVDLAFSDDQILTNFLRDVNDIEKDPQFYWLTFHIGRIGPWEQSNGEIGLSNNWCHVFGTKDSPCTLEEYVKLINDAEERARIYEERMKLQQQAPGTRWKSDCTLCGRKIRSIGLIGQDRFIAGLDMILEE